MARCGLRGWVTLGKTLMAFPCNTVDGRNPEPVEVGSLSYYLQGFIHRSWSAGAGFLPSTVPQYQPPLFKLSLPVAIVVPFFFGHIVPLTSFGAKLIGYFSEHRLMSFVLNPPKNCIRSASRTSFSPYSTTPPENETRQTGKSPIFNRKYIDSLHGGFSNIFTFQGWLKSRRSKWLEVGKCRFAVSVWYVFFW